MERTPSVAAGSMFRFRVMAVAVTVVVAAGAAACGSDSADVAQNGDGTSLYTANCAVCHGPDLRGTLTGPSMLSSLYEPAQLSDEAFRAAITSGVQQTHWKFGPMPMQPGLSSAEIDLILAYVRAAQQREGFEPYPPAP